MEKEMYIVNLVTAMLLILGFNQLKHCVSGDLSYRVMVGNICTVHNYRTFHA